MANGKTPQKRAREIGEGLRRRANEHAWSRDRWMQRRGQFGVVAALGAVASAGGIATLAADEPAIGIVSAVFGALASGAAVLEARSDPREKIEAHARAANAFSTLYSDFKTFYDVKAPTMEPSEAQAALDVLLEERKQLMGNSIAVERRARRKTKPK